MSAFSWQRWPVLCTAGDTVHWAQETVGVGGMGTQRDGGQQQDPQNCTEHWLPSTRPLTSPHKCRNGSPER